MKTLKLLLIGLLPIATIALPRAGPLRVVRVSYNPMPLNLPSIVLRRRGFLEEALTPLGWKVEWIANLQSGPLMSEALATGGLDIAAVMGETSAVVARAAGNDLVVVGPYSVAPRAFAIVVPKEAGAADLRSLTGRKIGLPVGTTAHYLLARALVGIGLSLARVAVVNMSVPDAAVAVASGKLDAAVLVEPVLSKMLAAGQARLLRDGAGLIGGLTVVAVRGEFLRQHRGVVKAYTQSLARAGEALKNQPDAALRLAAEETNLSPELLRTIAAKYTFLEIPEAEMLRELAQAIDFLAGQDLIARRPSLAEMVDRP